MTKISERKIEEFAVRLFQWIGYEYIPASETAPDSLNPERESYEEVLLMERLRESVRRINPDIPTDLLEEAIRKITHIASTELINLPLLRTDKPNDRTYCFSLTEYRL